MNGVGAVGLDLLEAERPVEAAGGRHRRERVEAHGLVAGFASGVDDRLGQPASQTGPLERRANVEPLHLADARLVGTERDAAGCVVALEREQQPPAGRGVVAGQLRELAVEVLKREVDLERGGVLGEELPYRRQAVLRVAVDDPQPHRAARVSAH